MSLAGDLFSVGGAVFGAKTTADATKRAEEINAASQEKINQDKLNLIKGGSVDAYGNILNRLDPETGALKTTLGGPTQQLANKSLSNAQAGADIRGEYGNVGKRAIADFSGFTATGGRPDFSLKDAQGIVTADDNRLLQSLVNPALNNAAVLDNRRLGGTSNAGNIVGKTMKELLPQVKLGGETRALDLKNKQDQSYIANTMGISDNVLKQLAGGPQVGIPGAASAGELGNLANSMSVPVPTTTPDLGLTALSTGASALGQAINKNEAQDRADAQFEALVASLPRDQQNAATQAAILKRLQTNSGAQ